MNTVLDVDEIECQFLFMATTSLAQAAIDETVVVRHVGGDRAFRRRLMEMGLVPGTAVTVRKIAPLGDPIELSARGCNLSIRAAEARVVEVDRP